MAKIPGRVLRCSCGSVIGVVIFREGRYFLRVATLDFEKSRGVCSNCKRICNFSNNLKNINKLMVAGKLDEIEEIEESESVLVDSIIDPEGIQWKHRTYGESENITGFDYEALTKRIEKNWNGPESSTKEPED